MRSNSYCYLTVDSEDSYIFLEFSYNIEFIAKIKKMVPHEFRSYNATEKKWTIHPRFARRIMELAKAHFEKVWLIESAVVTDLHTGEVK